MLRTLIISLALFASTSKVDAAEGDDETCACDLTVAACDAGCACDFECEVDWSVDECAEPGAECDPDATDVDDDAALEAAEQVAGSEEDVTWEIDPALVACPEGATNEDGHCTPSAIGEVSGGCSAGKTAGIAIALGVLGLLVLARRRRGLVAFALVACTIDTTGWDEAVERGPTGDSETYLDLFSAELGDRTAQQYLLAHQSLDAAATQPVAQMSLSRVRDDVGIYRSGERLVTGAGGELLGWARASAGDGTAELVELTAPDGSFAYETAAESIDALVADGFTITNRLGFVWPPGLADPILDDDETDTDEVAGPKPCTVSKHRATKSALVLLYASPGPEESERFLVGCPGEVVVGEKRETGPVGRMKSPAAQAAGGRTGFVGIDRNGSKLRALLMRKNGVERTVAYMKKKLRLGYDYIVIDEITAHPDFRDGTTLNRRLRRLMLRMPIRTVIPYISIDLTQQPGGFEAMRARRLLLRSFKLRARALALEVYLHTPQVMAGSAPATFRRAADRLALAVSGLPRAGGINLRAITVLGTSIHGGTSNLPQYSYLDRPGQDLASITRQASSIRHGSKRLRQQHGLGYYFVFRGDMKPHGGAPYSYDALIRRLRLQALRFE